MTASNPTEADTIALTGASGYVGGRLAPLLLDRGYRLRCFARSPRKLEQRSWRSHPDVEVVPSDLSDVGRLAEQLRGCTHAYYLVHSMIAAGSDYADRDRLLAGNFAQAAAKAGVEHIIYLGGLGDADDSLSEHLRSRRETEAALASTGVPVTVLRAAMIIGSGSASFEILQYLVHRLPVMITPRWVETECQPVAIRDVLHWLCECLSTPETQGRVLEVGGPDVVSYRDLMQVAAREMGISQRLILTVPILSPRLSSAWISLVTPVPYKIARPLADGLCNRVVVGDHPAQALMPHDPLPVDQAIQKAVSTTLAGRVATRWSAAGRIPGDPDWAGGKVFMDRRSIDIDADAETVYAAVCRIGGGNGWYAGDLLWKLRGWMDQAVGGPGLRRGRRHPEDIEYGESLDFWRVIGLEKNRSLALWAEMKLPGDAQLDFDTNEIDQAPTTRLTMTARYRPRGLLGIAYWYAVVPLHNLVFGGMLKGIRDTAEALVSSTTQTVPSEATTTPSAGYGRARLWLGISAVGSMVVLAGLGLWSDAPRYANQVAGSSLSGLFATLVGFVLLYTLIQLPFDLFGGYLLPKAYGRSHPPLTAFALSLARGVAVHSVVLLLAGLAISVAGGAFGLPGVIAVATFGCLILLTARVYLASLTASLTVTPSDPSGIQRDDALRVLLADSPDEGFTGGVTGLFRPSDHLLPLAWRRALGQEGFELALRRRSLAVSSGGWLRGRIVALAFTLSGVAWAAYMAGPDLLGTVGGAIAISLWFTLWSFAGLLTLPTLSRAGVSDIDQRLRAAGNSPESIDRATRTLDGLQDDEPARPTLVETIFHPIPSVENRLRGPRSHGVLGAWDAARTTVYLSASGLGLLGRAVHCNCGRPSLWVFLPTD